MGQSIVKLDKYYLIWSSIVDAPISAGMTLDELTEWVREEDGRRGLDLLPERLARVEAKGTSSLRDDSAVSTIWLNRAGPDESTLSILGIYRHYCLDEPIRPEWIMPGRVIGGDDDDDFDLHGAVTAGWPPSELEATDATTT